MLKHGPDPHRSQAARILVVSVVIDMATATAPATGTSMKPESPALTANDIAVLSALFNAESSPFSSCTISQTTPCLPGISDSTVAHLRQQEMAAIQSLDSESPSESAIQIAISNLSYLINKHPNYAPAYLNRAQATRLLIEGEDHLFAPSNSNPLSNILSDLSAAISLASPCSPTDPLSDLQATVLSKAHTHRGYLLLQASQVTHRTGSALPAQITGMHSEQSEERASQDFSLGGRYGNSIARELGVKMNPYAKMCGEVVQEAMRREKR